MGYSEQVCQICGVSFNIARIRRPDEPRSAAWVYYGEDFVDAEYTIRECGRSSGCMILDRNAEEDVLQDPWKLEKESINGEDGDGAGDEENAEFAPDAEEDDEEDEPDLDGFDDLMRVEHIAGPKCSSSNGYSGHRLSLEEMSHCRVWQTLVRKPDEPTDFEPSPDDEPFERSENIVLSGISDNMPETADGGQAFVYPIRHNIQVPNVTNAIFDSTYRYVNTCAMPFHPWCLEVFKQASHAKTGKVDMAGLWGWYEHEADYHIFHEQFPRNGPTNGLRQQWWQHAEGSEWTVCNPLFMPTLADTLQTAISTDPTFDPGQGAFNIPDDQIPFSTQDPFTTLPTEIRLIILQDLSSKDIDSLRLSSRAFRQLPISLWHRLVEKEFPWFWEASTSSLPTYSFWTTTSAEELKANPIQEEDRQPVPVPNTLDPTRTNWHKLYHLLKQRENDAEYRSLRGLRNRERIWKDCEEILRRIEAYRERDEIPVLDFAKLVRERTEATRRRNRERMEAHRREQERDQGVVTHTAAAQPL